MSDERLLEIALNTAKKAGQEIMHYYRHGNFTAEMKADDSPVTSADLAANQTIMDELQSLTPEIPIISEEVGPLPLAQRKVVASLLAVRSLLMARENLLLAAVILPSILRLSKMAGQALVLFMRLIIT